MSNPPAQGSQGQPQQQLLKAEDLARLRCLGDDQKQKYRPVLQNFWQMVQTKPQGSPEYTQARAKLLEWSTKLIAQEKAYRTRQQQLQQQNQNQNPQTQQTSQAQPKSQPGNDQQPPAQPAQPPKQPPVVQPQSQAPQQGNNRPQGGPVNPQQQPHNPEVLKHVETFPYRLPPGSVPGNPEAEKRYKDMKNSYLAALTKQEKTSSRLRNINSALQQRQQAGQEAPPELLSQKQQEENQYAGAKRFVEDFRKRQQEWRAAGLPVYVPQQQQQTQAQPQAQPQAPTQAQAQPQPQNPSQNIVKPEPVIKVEGGQGSQPPQQFTNMQSGGTPQQPQQNAQVPASSVNQPPHRPPPASQQSHPFASGQQQPHQPQRPQINPQQANAQLQQQNNSPHPQSATSTGPGGPPVPLTHHAAVTAAQRSYSNPDAQRTTTPLQSGPGNFPMPGSREREQLNNPKLPIPRNLNTSTPVPVAMGQARPTMSGPTNGAPGPMGQPVINKFPPFQLEGEGDRVLSKRKLDELVRQVTGGAEDALTPEVEEAMLALADEFVDSVITSACKLSKLRESSNLEIRDLQLVLERNYNIRIPGYASDEVRTVRKLIPAAGWTQKMNAVQAAKVMGGKTDI